MSEKLHQIARALNGAQTEEGLTISAEIVDEREQMMRIEIEGREELPILLDIDDEQILVAAELWSDAEVKEGVAAEMMEAMLRSNMPMSLSAFARSGDAYQLFGAIAANARPEEILHEISVLSVNVMTAFDAFGRFLKQ